MDATVANVYIVSRLDRRFVICRPTIYFVVDTWSRLIVGLYVGLETPSWKAAMMAIINCVEDKVEYCKKSGIEIEAFQWPSAHLPACLLADKAELLSVRLGKDIVDSLKVRIDNTPGWRPELKAIVERRFGIYESSFGPYMPGYVERNWGERGAPDPRKTAAYDLDQFTKAVILAVIDHNNNRVITGYPSPPKMVGDELPAIPYLLWHWGIANLSGALATRTPDEVRMSVYPEVTVTETERGIEYCGITYNSPTCHEQGWKAKARRKGTWNLVGRVNPNRLGELYIATDGRKYEKCVIADSKLQDIALSEMMDFQFRTRNLAAIGIARSQPRQIGIQRAHRQVESDATKKTSDALSASGLRYPIEKHSREARAAEQAYWNNQDFPAYSRLQPETVVAEEDTARKYRR